MGSYLGSSQNLSFNGGSEALALFLDSKNVCPPERVIRKRNGEMPRRKQIRHNSTTEKGQTTWFFAIVSSPQGLDTYTTLLKRNFGYEGKVETRDEAVPHIHGDDSNDLKYRVLSFKTTGRLEAKLDTEALLKVNHQLSVIYDPSLKGTVENLAKYLATSLS